ncbi:L-threonylcarbamoyladenylate synthase [Flavihumibacter profundi]|uniref:L-threonylcarbamoyladenylate synthase n=1 Tax=Flavihumibacter profundi TaxID=2716883 RepID=UPI001CC46CD8|nr:L-threonylcarbamoyladenylate synthase [Flavihumibacter profundi]MBZ5856647.1 threonylcarbamoyl-AMP synthase [Flavihumibacter profundi]
MKENLGTDILLAADYLRAGELVAIPTETVYGLAANALNEAAVVKIYAVKNRPQFNPLILHVAGLDQLKPLDLELPPKALELAAKFSPGPLTYVVPSSVKIPGIVTAGTPAVAIRIPAHPMTLELLNQLDFPLAAPSANPSGMVSPTTALHVAQQLGNQVSYILDGGACKVGLESTIISFLGKTPQLLRYGGISLEAIEAVIGPVALPAEGFVDNPVAPGMLARHYATIHPLLLGDANAIIKQAHASNPIPRIASISLYQHFTALPDAYQFQLSPSGDLNEAARKLFSAMRMADEMDIDLIVVERFPEKGLGRAINDRLRRASSAHDILFNTTLNS